MTNNQVSPDLVCKKYQILSIFVDCHSGRSPDFSLNHHGMRDCHFTFLSLLIELLGWKETFFPSEKHGYIVGTFRCTKITIIDIAYKHTIG